MKKRKTVKVEQEFLAKWRVFASPMKAMIKKELLAGANPRQVIKGVFHSHGVREHLKKTILDSVMSAYKLGREWSKAQASARARMAND